MIGGDHSFGAGFYKKTPVEKALPVFMDDLFTAKSALKKYGRSLWPYLVFAFLLLLIVNVAVRKMLNFESMRRNK